MISFAGGLPNPASFPKDILGGLYSELCEKRGEEILQYGASEGSIQLRKSIKSFEDAGELPDSELMITVGATNAIYYFTRTFINPGDVIITELPAFPGSIAAMQACGAVLHGIEMDDEGILPDRLQKTLSKNNRVKFIYLIPEFQNPSGKTMTLERRREIIRIAEKFNIPILEDQPYRELRYSGKRIPSIGEIARTEFNNPNIVTIVKSYSKILGPGLRIGFASGPEYVIDKMVKWQQKITVSPDNPAQLVVSEFINRGYMSGHIDKILSLYKPRRQAMLEALEQYMPDFVEWTKPDGGMFIWLKINKTMDTGALLEKAIEHKIAFIPGENFYPDDNDRGKNELRLNFSYPSEKDIDIGIRRLSEIL